MKYFIIITCLIFIGSYSYTQDTINFKLYDSLKTKTEDSHKSVLSSFELNKTGSITNGDPDNMDVRMFRSINNSHSPFKTKMLYTTDNTALPVTVLSTVSILGYGRVRRKTYDENSGYLTAVSEMTSLAAVFGIKFIVKRRRPVDVLKNVNTKESPYLDKYSFPSGHTAMSISLATMFALRYPKYPQVYAPMYLWALMVAYGRPYFGLHYPSDLLGGALIGGGSSILIYSLRKELFNFKNQVLGEDNNDDGSINGGVVSFFAASLGISAILDNFVFRQRSCNKFFISPWMDSKRSGLNVKWKL